MLYNFSIIRYKDLFRINNAEFLLAYGKLTIKDFEQLCPDVNRRSLQRDLKDFLKKRLTKESGTGTTDPTRHYFLSEL